MDDPTLLVESLGSVNCAQRLQPRSPEVRFNEGLILEALGLRDAARRAFEHYQTLDPASQWTEEARQHAANLQRPTAADAWNAEQRVLERAAASGDSATVTRIVQSFPEEARSWSETVYLGEWGEALIKGNPAVAQPRRAIAESIGNALTQINGDSFVSDAVSATTTKNSQRDALARAHSTYLDARRRYAARDIAGSSPLFAEAENGFAKAHSVMQWAAAAYHATALYDVGETDRAEKMLRKVLGAIAPKHYALRGQVLWALANVFVRQGLLHQALSNQREALEIFRRAGEEENRAAMTRLTATTLSALGRRAEGWRLRIRAFEEISRTGNAREMQTALDTAARLEALDERWDTALPLLALAAESRLQQNPRVYASTLLWHALASQRLATGGVERLDDARRAAGSLKDPKLRERAQLDVRLIEAITASHDAPHRAVSLLDAYLLDADRIDHRFFMPEARLQRARLRRSLGQPQAAESDLREVIRLQAARRPTDGMAVYFRTRDEAVRELVDLLLEREDAGGAFQVLDGSRREDFPAATNLAIGRSHEGQIVVEYLVERDRLLIFVAGDNQVRATSVPVSERTLLRAAEELITELRMGHESAANRRLTAWVIDPIADMILKHQTVIVVPDRVLMTVPFAALRLPDGRYVIDHVNVAFAPSRGLATIPQGFVPQRMVAVGDPAFDPTVFDLSRLPGAAREAKAVADLYRESLLLTGSMATKKKLLSEMLTADVLHLAMHAVVAVSEPGKSYLALAPTSDEGGELTVGDIGYGTLRSRLIVLAGCRTGVPSPRTPLSSTLTLAFLAAGAESVVGTLWDLPDEAAEKISLRFHHEILLGSDAVSALRTAQLAALHSNDRELSSPAVWGSFQVYVNGAARSAATAEPVRATSE